MNIEYEDVTNRWKSIRSRPECDLDLNPEAVARYLSMKESDLAQEKIKESLEHLADLRIARGKYLNDDPPSEGDLVVCEGLEAFLVPAVEEIFTLSEFLDNYVQKEEFVNALCKDIEYLLEIWEKHGFSGAPYTNPDGIAKIINPDIQDKFEKVNITESAAMACRVIIHLLTLYFNRPNEKIYNKMMGERMKKYKIKLINALSDAVSFLVDAFQKGKDDKNLIGSAEYRGKPGSGWSWTNFKGLPPMMFFTASAVDAFAELDLYLIRPAVNDTQEKFHKELKDFYEQNESVLMDYQFCVDMARRWVENAVLPVISKGLGFYYEQYEDSSFIEFKDVLEEIEKKEEYEAYKKDLQQVEGIERSKDLLHSPIVLYNNLYALLILLWTFGDWDDDGAETNKRTKGRIQRSLMQLVYNYTSIPVFHEILNRFRYTFYLPGKLSSGKNIFQEVGDMSKRSYMDSGFLTLLTRQLVLYAVYGVGDRNVLDPLISNLYIDLLLNRYRLQSEYSNLWSKNDKEIFSTQRAIQALTFYTAYAKGKEAASVDLISLFSNVVNKLKRADGVTTEEDKKVAQRIDTRDFLEYCKDKGVIFPSSLGEEDRENFRLSLLSTGRKLLNAHNDDRLDYVETVLLLDEVVKLVKLPWDQGGIINYEALEKINEKCKKVLPSVVWHNVGT